jgi:chromosome partitioning protein
MGKTIAISNLKGGVGKTMTSASLGAGLARQGKSVFCLDADAQHSLTVSFGVKEPDKLPITLTTMLHNIITETTGFDPVSGIIHHSDGVDILPSNNTLAGLEISLAGLVIGRETVLRQYIEMVKTQYDYIIVDCAPSLDLLTVNALSAADSVIIPVVPCFLDAKGLELLLKRITQVRRQINPSLSIDGILLTMVDKRAYFTRDIISLVENAYGSNIRIFGEHIPRSIRASESTAQGVSIFTYDPNGKVAAAYAALTREVLSDVA